MTTTALHKTAHDPGDPLITSHCPFCGSGQIAGRPDGTISCEFCGQCYIVRVQPAFPGMPQAPGMGAPTDTGPELLDPSMIGPDGMPLGGDPMMEAGGELPPDAGVEEDGEGEDGAPPWAGDEEEEGGGEPPPDDSGDEGGSGPPSKGKDKGSKEKSGPPGKKKKSSRDVSRSPAPRRYRSASGALLTEEPYIRHLAVLCSGGSPEVLARMRSQPLPVPPAGQRASLGVRAAASARPGQAG